MQRSWCWRIVFAVDVETCSCCQTGSSPSRCRACPDVHFGWTIATFAWQRVNPNMCLCYVLSRNVLWLFIYAHILIHIIAHKYIYIYIHIYIISWYFYRCCAELQVGARPRAAAAGAVASFCAPWRCDLKNSPHPAAVKKMWVKR